jgi:hypothetical protein
MSSGHRHTDAAPVSAVVSLFQKHVGLRNFQCWPCMVSRKFLVPYGAGRSADGGMTYLDEGIPERFRMGVEPDKYACCHEGIEWWLMTRLDKAYWQGPGAKSAHWWATGYEHMMLKLDGYSDDEIASYEEEWLTYISADEATRISPETVPPDLFQGPYEAAGDSDAGEDALDAKILPILQQARARMLLVQNARV